MAKKRGKGKKGFEEKHPFIFLATLPVSLPIAVAADMAKQKKPAKKRGRLMRLPRNVMEMDGYQFEEYVARKLASAGYTSVDVTPKSGDYGADIIAYSPNGIFRKSKRVCFQCKKYSKPVGVKAVQEINAAKTYYQCDAAAVVSNAGYTDQARKLAESTGVVLMDVGNIQRL